MGIIDYFSERLDYDDYKLENIPRLLADSQMKVKLSQKEYDDNIESENLRHYYFDGWYSKKS